MSVKSHAGGSGEGGGGGATLTFSSSPVLGKLSEPVTTTSSGFLHSLNEDIMAGIVSSKAGDSLSNETDSFLTALNFKDKHPLMLFDKELKFYYRAWKGISNTRSTTELIILALNSSIIMTYVFKFVAPSQPLRVELWPIYAVDASVIFLNLLSIMSFKVLARSPNINCHTYVDMTKVPSFDAVYSDCKTWDQWIFTYLWYERYYWVAAKCGAEVLSMMILLVEQTFANGTCTAHDMKNVVLQLYWLDCNIEGVTQTTSIFTAMRLMLHSFTYIVLARAEFELIMAIHALSLAFLTVCNLLTPSMAFLHPTISYGVILALACIYFERNQRLLYLREIRFRHTERKLRDQRDQTASFQSTDVHVNQRGGAAFPPSLSSLSQSE